MKWTAEKEHLLKTSMDTYREENNGTNISWPEVYDIWINNNGDISASPKKLKSKWQFITKFGNVKSGIETGGSDSMM